MKLRTILTLSVFTLLMGAVPPIADAQPIAAQIHPNLSRGFDSETYLDRTQWDSINRFNGNLNLSLPLGQWYALKEGFGYQLTLSYNSNIWDLSQMSSTIVTASPNRNSNAGVGWDLSFGRLIDPFAGNNGLGKWIYISPDGALHSFYANLHYDVFEPDNAVHYTRDGTYYRLQQINSSTTIVESPDGSVRTFELVNNEWRLIKISDRFNNYLAISYATTNTWTLTDNHGRTQTILFKSDPTGAYPLIVDRVLVSTFGGGKATYIFTYTTGLVTRSNVDNDPSTSATVNLPMLSHVTAPDGSKYWFGYNPVNASSDASGRLASMQLPTLGKLEWTYQKYSFASPSCISNLNTIYRANTGISSRRMIDISGGTVGAWSFSQSFKSSGVPTNCSNEGEMTNTVTTPLGDKYVHYFSVNLSGTSSNTWNCSDYALPLTKDHIETISSSFLSRQIYDCDGTGSNCQLLQSLFVRYQQDGNTDPNSAEVINTNRREVAQRTLYHDDVENGVVRFAGVERSDFDGLGHFRREVSNGNFGNADVRERIIDYDAGVGVYPSSNFVMPAITQPWLINIHRKQKTVEGNSSQVTEVCHDRTTGFVTRQRLWWSSYPTGTTNAKDVLVVYTPDAAGRIIKEQHYGGDVQSIDSSNLCTAPLPGTDQYQIRHTYQYGNLSSSQFYTSAGDAFGTRTIDRDLDQNTGLIRTNRDTAGLATQYEYDQLGKVTWIKPSTGHGAWTHYIRTVADGSNNARTFIYKKGNGTGAVLTYKAEVQDSFGRIWFEQTSMPDGTLPGRVILRNALGWRTHTTEYNIGTPKYTVYFGHDPFGRPKVIVPPDGQNHNTYFQYAGFRTVRSTVSVATTYNKWTGQVNEAARSSTKVYDRQNRLWKEINHIVDSFGSLRDVVTSHRYDVGDRLLETKKDNARVGALRTYDGRGFLTSEITEGARTETLAYLEFDARGRSRRSQRHSPGNPYSSPAHLAYDYDRAARLVKVRDPNDATKVWKEFIYAITNEPNDWRAGKLCETKRYNDMSRFLPQVGVATVGERYIYGAVDGRLSQYEIGFLDQIGRAEKFYQTFTYTELGDVKEVGYPNDVPGSGYVDIGRDRKVNYTYSNGFLTSVSGVLNGQNESWANSISYHPHGLISQLTHANGVTDIVTKDPNGFIRAGAFSTNGARNPITNAPDNINIVGFQYDGKGNLVKAGSEYFVPEQGYQPLPTPPSSPYVGPCESGWKDSTGVVYATADSSCNAKVFYYYTADDTVYKIEDGIRQEKIWHFTDQAGRPLTDYVMIHSHYLPWSNTWEYTRDYIHNGGSQFALHETRRDGPSTRLHYHRGYGATGILTDQNGHRIQE